MGLKWKTPSWGVYVAPLTLTFTRSTSSRISRFNSSGLVVFQWKFVSAMIFFFFLRSLLRLEITEMSRWLFLTLPLGLERLEEKKCSRSSLWALVVIQSYSFSVFFQIWNINSFTLVTADVKRHHCPPFFSGCLVEGELQTRRTRRFVDVNVRQTAS